MKQGILFPQGQRYALAVCEKVDLEGERLDLYGVLDRWTESQIAGPYLDWREALREADDLNARWRESMLSLAH